MSQTDPRYSDPDDPHSTTLAAPVLPIDYPADSDPIKACPFCLPWSVEIITEHPEYGLAVREWHAIGCPILNQEN